MTLKLADPPDDKQRAKLDAIDDIAMIAQILRALGTSPDAVEAAVVHWLGVKLNGAAEVLEDRG